MSVCVLQLHDNLETFEEQTEKVLRYIHQVQLKSSFKKKDFDIVVVSFYLFFLAMELIFVSCGSW